MIFDLRPVATGTKQTSANSSQFDDSCFGEEYSTEPDELGYNSANASINREFSSHINAVTYTPAIVFREYPYSTVEGVDLSGLMVDNSNPLGFVPFGPVFSVKNDEDDRYRALYDYTEVHEIEDGKISIAPVKCQLVDGSKPMKHLDVVVIRDPDVVSSVIGRSDNDTWNLFAMYAEDALQAVYKFILNAFMPVTNAVSIARNGLRVREMTTRYAPLSRNKLCGGPKEKKGTLQNGVVRNMVRWLMLVDHWNQHNIEYLTGTIVLRGMPELRVGYRLDWEDRRESYYVDSVSHSWNYLKEMTTTIQVSRGQRNDPYLSYVPPNVETLTSQTLKTQFDVDANVDIGDIDGGVRDSTGRLAEYFKVLSTQATYRAVDGTDVFQEIPSSNSPNRLDEPYYPYALNSRKFPGEIIYAGDTRQRSLSEENADPTERAVEAAEVVSRDIGEGVWPIGTDATYGEPTVAVEYDFDNNVFEASLAYNDSGPPILPDGTPVVAALEGKVRSVAPTKRGS
jgi:hypothetical protein